MQQIDQTLQGTSAKILSSQKGFDPKMTIYYELSKLSSVSMHILN